MQSSFQPRLGNQMSEQFAMADLQQRHNHDHIFSKPQNQYHDAPLHQKAATAIIEVEDVELDTSMRSLFDLPLVDQPSCSDVPNDNRRMRKIPLKRNRGLP